MSGHPLEFHTQVISDDVNAIAFNIYSKTLTVTCELLYNQNPQGARGAMR